MVMTAKKRKIMTEYVANFETIASDGQSTVRILNKGLQGKHLALKLRGFKSDGSVVSNANMLSSIDKVTIKVRAANGDTFDLIKASPSILQDIVNNYRSVRDNYAVADGEILIPLVPPVMANQLVARQYGVRTGGLREFSCVVEYSSAVHSDLSGGTFELHSDYIEQLGDDLEYYDSEAKYSIQEQVETCDSSGDNKKIENFLTNRAGTKLIGCHIDNATAGATLNDIKIMNGTKKFKHFTTIAEMENVDTVLQRDQINDTISIPLQEIPTINDDDVFDMMDFPAFNIKYDTDKALNTFNVYSEYLIDKPVEQNNVV